MEKIAAPRTKIGPNTNTGVYSVCLTASPLLSPRLEWIVQSKWTLFWAPVPRTANLVTAAPDGSSMWAHLRAPDPMMNLRNLILASGRPDG
ncbi:uncharacterized protein ANIA_11431 [Aspergillus nidulans FGSC A4]|uniref:Uncharacterized protein n=1 Tax=Emericella nidulans (strain FGSC A4 / ATCC 38163 / CBS 112.46 / NRRL 194 / M139) TaxID=227321 RepID=C8V4K8_EMENI|nr:hypothetical protein [Aspergillus nidulans FGSC A4]CBF74502.1 TPA: hypothetical protein ANIA_11431 [Aspergillus nidulans FGSC A4]